MSKINEKQISSYMNSAQRSLQSAEHSFDAGYYNTAINRSYYAFFYAASAILLTRDIGRSKHSGVLSSFRQHFIKTGLIENEHSQTYGAAFNTRQLADYLVTLTVDESQARQIIDEANDFVSRIGTYLVGVGY